jgi:CHASE3 domain sensor protein
LSRFKSNSYTLVGIIESWNSSLILEGIELSETVKLEVSIRTNRLYIFLLGILLIIVGIIVSFLSVMIKRRE